MDKIEALATVNNAMLTLSGHCDGASSLDGVGWNKMDTIVGKHLAAAIAASQPLDPEDRNWITNHLPKYRRQIGEVKEALLVLGWVEEATTAARVRREEREKRQQEKEERARQREELISNPNFPKLDFNPEEDKFYLYTRPQDRPLANGIPSGWWKPEIKAWRYLNNEQTIKAIQKIISQIPTISPQATTAFGAGQKKASERQAQLQAVSQIKAGTARGLTLPLKTQPYAHQLAAFEIGVTIPNAALLMEQGTGKTLSAMAVAGHRYLQGQIKRLLIVAPKSVLGEWKRQFNEHADFPHRAEVLYGDLAERKGILRSWRDTEGLQIVAINYEATWRMEEELVRWSPNMIIADESQKIKNAQAQQSKAMVSIGKKAKYRLILTGTPISQTPLDFFSQYKFLDPSVFGTSFVKFRDQYAIMGGYGGYQIVGYRNLEQLATKAHSIAYRVTKEEALDLPPTVDQNLYAELEPEAKKIYKEMEKEALLVLGDDRVTAPIVLTQLLRLQQITGGFLPGEDKPHQVSKAKMEVLEDAVEDLVAAGKKVVVFARFVPEVEEMTRRLTAKRILSCKLTGKASSQQREDMIREFQNGPTRVFIAQIATGGVGITLTAADTAIFYSVDFSLTNYEQAKARIHRIGQDKKVTYLHIIAQGTIDEEVMKKLQKKQDMAKMVVDDLRNILKGEKSMKKAKVVGKAAQEVVNQQEEPTSGETQELDRMLDELERELQANGVTQTPLAQIKPQPVTNAVEPKKNKPKEEPKPTATANQPAGVNGDIITVKELAQDLSADPRKLRKWLRSNYGQTDGRWEWKHNDPQLAKIRKDFK